MSPEPKKHFALVLIKPSHYDDDGYVIQWLRSALPSNTLATLYGLSLDCAARRVLGPDTEIDIHAFDETNTVIRAKQIAKLIDAADDGMVMLVGVQSNQFPRALDIARDFRNLNIKVGIGGFHVSGTIAMLPDRDPQVQAAIDIGVSVFAGEAEGRLEHVLLDAAANDLQPVYNFMEDLPGIDGVPAPVLPAERVYLTLGATTSFDAGRGCPFACSFCTIINVQGRKSRRRTPDDIETIVRANTEQGLHSFFITDDNFARNKDWEVILDRLIYLREEEGLKTKFAIQVDTLCHKLPHFIEKCQRAGVKRVFIGLENINPDSLLGAKKRQNKITDYREMLLAWKHAGVITYCGYILGFPDDTRESILRDIEIIKRELPLDLLEFFYLTPLPGSEDHKRLYESGVPMDPDLNKYDLNHDVTGHPTMSREEWRQVYAEAWQTYYTDEHVETILRRSAACDASPGKALFFIVWFKSCLDIEGVHPLEGGLVRRKVRRNRRHGLPLENPLSFYPKYFFESLGKLVKWGRLYFRFRMIYLRIKKDPAKFEYMDTALEPVTDHEEDRDMFQTAAAQSYLEKVHRNERLSRGEYV